MGFTVERFDHIVLNCRDVEATASWYERVLGMTRQTFGPSHRTALSFGNQKINLRPLGAQADDPDWVTGSVEAAGSEDLCFITRSTPKRSAPTSADCAVDDHLGTGQQDWRIGSDDVALLQGRRREPDRNRGLLSALRSIRADIAPAN